MSDFIESEWISVKDRLPDRDGEYLCVWRDFADRYLVVNFANNLNKIHANNFLETEPGWYLYDNNYGYYQTTRVTHWMPLPELPNDGVNEWCKGSCPEFLDYNQVLNNSSVSNVPQKAVWIHSVDGIYCSHCWHKLHTTGIPQVCPYCYSQMTDNGWGMR